jgi:hypothetical protein
MEGQPAAPLQKAKARKQQREEQQREEQQQQQGTKGQRHADATEAAVQGKLSKQALRKQQVAALASPLPTSTTGKGKSMRLAMASTEDLPAPAMAGNRKQREEHSTHAAGQGGGLGQHAARKQKNAKLQ